MNLSHTDGSSLEIPRDSSSQNCFKPCSRDSGLLWTSMLRVWVSDEIRFMVVLIGGSLSMGPDNTQPSLVSMATGPPCPLKSSPGLPPNSNLTQ